MSVYVFSCAIGFLWLSTVPLTSGLVAEIFGVRYLSMLGGIVFLSHQIGSFLGVWLGGRLYDMTGSYDVVWWISIGLGPLRRRRQPADPRAGAAAPGGGMSPRRRRLAAALGWAAAAVALALGFARLSAARTWRSTSPTSCGTASRAAACMSPGRRRLPLAAALGAPDPPRRPGPRPRRRRRPAQPLARGERLRGHRRRSRCRGDGCARRHRRDAWSPTSRARPGRSPAAASTRCWSPTISGGRCFRRSSKRSARTASCSTRPSPPATRPSADPPGRTFCSPAVNF